MFEKRNKKANIRMYIDLGEDLENEADKQTFFIAKNNWEMKLPQAKQTFLKNPTYNQTSIYKLVAKKWEMD